MNEHEWKKRVYGNSLWWGLMMPWWPPGILRLDFVLFLGELRKLGHVWKCRNEFYTQKFTFHQRLIINVKCRSVIFNENVKMDSMDFYLKLEGFWTRTLMFPSRCLGLIYNGVLLPCPPRWVISLIYNYIFSKSWAGKAEPKNYLPKIILSREDRT